MTRKKTVSYAFPFTLEDSFTGASATLYSEKDRPTITYRLRRPDGSRTEKRTLPKTLPRAMRRPTATGEVPAETVDWMKTALAATRISLEASKAAARASRGNRVPVATLCDRVSQTAWYEKLTPKQREAYARAIRWVVSQLEADFRASHWDQDVVDRLIDARMAGVLSTDKDKRPTYLKAASHNTAVRDLALIKTIHDRATRLKFAPGVDEYLLDSNPFSRIDLPEFTTRHQRKAMDERRHRILLELATEIDPTGRFEFLLEFQRWSGRRLITVLRMTDRAILVTYDEIRAALDEQLCRYVDEAHRDAVARLYLDACGGALFIRWWWEKSGQSAKANRAEQYDAVTPVAPALIRARAKYFAVYRDRLNLPSGAPLIPGDDLTRPLPKETALAWMKRAKQLAAERGLELGLGKGDGGHGYRKMRRTDFRKVDVKHARFLVGHSIRTGTPGITVSEGIYLGLVPEDLVEAVLMGEGAR